MSVSRDSVRLRFTEVLKTGRGDITTAFVSMARWRTPRAPTPTTCAGTLSITAPSNIGSHAVRASLRLVSTPDGRAARAIDGDRYDPIDHVMTYFFTASSGLDGFN